MSTKFLPTSAQLLARAKAVIPGGVNSPVRAFKSVGGNPIFMQKGRGAYVYDVDGNRYIDYVGSWGPMILGHNHPRVIAAIKTAIDNGIGFGAPTHAEVVMAELITSIMPNIKMLRMVNSGTEAAMSAIRLARGFTKKNKILKFDHCYHGHCDSLLVNAGSGLLTFGISGSAGVTPETAGQTLVAPFNDLVAVAQIFAQHGDDIAAIIVEPIAANNNLILPTTEFLPGLRTLCDKYNSLLIFDEIITGFRVALGGAQELYNIKPDLTCLGKIIGGGMPVGAFGGRREIMQLLAPIGPVYQAGTLSGNPVAMAAGIATIQELQKPGVYEQLSKASTAIANMFAEHDDVNVPHIGGVFGLQFKDPAIFKRFFHNMLDHGIYLAPSAFESGFISTAHDSTILEHTSRAIERVMQDLYVEP